MAACTDFGLAGAFLAALAEKDAERYGALAEEMRRRSDKAAYRKARGPKRKPGRNLMSSFEKYRVHEVAKDLGLSSKVITEILTKHATAPKNHMQVLDDNELSIIFEVLTQEHQCADIL